MEPKPLTEAEEKVLAAIKTLYRSKRRAPTVREIGDECGYDSTSTTHVHLKNLERKGALQRGAPGQPRSITLTSEAGSCPLCGHDLP